MSPKNLEVNDVEVAFYRDLKNDYIVRCSKIVALYFDQRFAQDNLGVLTGCRLDYLLNEIKALYDEFYKEQLYGKSKK